jgi:two-component sensor histidine kinase
MTLSLKHKIAYSALLASLLMGLIIVVAAMINIQYNIERIDLYRQHEAVAIAKVLDASFQNKDDLRDISFAQGLIDRLMLDQSLKRVSIHAKAPEGKSPSGYWHLASTAPERVGRPSDPEDIVAIKSGDVITMTESSTEPASKDEHTVDVTYPLHDLTGKHIGIAGITLYYDVFEGETKEHEFDEARKKALAIGQSLDAAITSERQLTHRNYAQVEIDDIVKKLPHISRFSIHSEAPEDKGPSGYRHLASSAQERVGRPSDAEDIESIKNDKHVVLFETDAEGNRHIDVTYPIHNIEGKAIAAAGITISLKEDDVILAEANKRTFLNALWYMLGIFIVGVIFSLFFSSYIARLISEPIRQYENEIKSSLEEKEVLLKEIHHRVKNNMSIVSAMLQLQDRYSSDSAVKAILEDSQNRINSMAMVHEKLYESENLSSINLQSYVKELAYHLLATCSYEKISFKHEIDDIALDIDHVIPMGLLLNELLTNSIKHAFSSVNSPEIGIHLSANEGVANLIYSDNGAGLPEYISLKDSKSLGLKIIYMLSYQLKGTINLDETNRAKYTLSFPI